MHKSFKPVAPSGYKMFAVFCMLLGIVAVLGICYFNYQKKNIVFEKQNDLAAIADLRVAQIGRWRTERLNHIEYIYKNPLFYRQVKAFFDNPGDAEKQNDVLTWLKSLQELKIFDDVYLFDAGGTEIFGINTSGPLGPHAKELMFRARIDLRPVFSDLHTATTVDFAHFDIAIPLVEPKHSGSLTGILFMRLKPQNGLYQRTQTWPTPSRSAETMLVRRENNNVLYLNDLRHKPDCALKLRLPVDKKNLVAGMAIKGEEGVFEGVDYRNVPVLAVSRKIPGTVWFMIAKVDRAEIYAPLRQQIWIAGAGVFLLAVIAGVTVRFWWWRQRSRFNLELYEERQRAEEKIRNLAAIVENSNVAIITTDLDGVITGWNRAAETIYGYKESEMFGKSVSMLTPPDRQNEIVEIVNKTKDGILVENYETIRLDKNGTPLNLSLTISPIFDHSGKVTGASSIALDVTAQKKIEDELRSNEVRLKLILDSLAAGVVLIDPETHLIADVNPAAARLIGAATDQIIGKMCHKFFCPAEEGNCPITDLKQTVDNSERIMLTADGRKLVIIKTATEVVIGKRKYILENFMDITEHKQAEMLLQKSEEEYHNLFESSRDAIVMLDMNGFVDCNKATLSMFGCADKELFMAKTFADFTPELQPDGQNTLSAAVNHIETAFTKGVDSFEWLNKRQDGTLFWVEVLLSRLEFRGRQVLQATFRDISERMNAKKALEEAYGALEKKVEERTASLNEANRDLQREIVEHKQAEEAVATAAREWQTTFDDINDAISLLGRDSRILKCNAAMVKLCGKASADELAGKHCYEVIHGTSEPIEGCPVVKSRQSRQREIIELPIGNRYFKVTADPLFDLQGEYSGAVHIISDITVRKQAELLVQQQNQELLELNASKDRFFSIIAHDLKNMFHNILGFSDLLVEEAARANIASIKEEVGAINSSVQETYKILGSLLEWANSQRGKISFNPESVILNKAVNEELSLLKETARHKNIELKISLPDNFKVTADKDMLRTVLRNLVSNAIKFTNKNGVIELQAVANQADALISVSDNGVGMTNDMVNNLFKLSSSTSTRGTNNEKGTGLGLLICQEFVQKHGGKIWAESEPGKGSSFKFTLPFLK
ncbi:MAG: PAS domain S-box protein [Victivallaceae bacterium]